MAFWVDISRFFAKATEGARHGIIIRFYDRSRKGSNDTRGGRGLVFVNRWSLLIMQRQHATLLLLSRNQPEEQHLDPEHPSTAVWRSGEVRTTLPVQVRRFRCALHTDACPQEHRRSWRDRKLRDLGNVLWSSRLMVTTVTRVPCCWDALDGYLRQRLQHESCHAHVL